MYIYIYTVGFLGVSDGKNLLAIQETWVQPLGPRPWKRERLPTPVFLPREFQSEKPSGLQSTGHKESRVTELQTQQHSKTI